MNNQINHILNHLDDISSVATLGKGVSAQVCGHGTGRDLQSARYLRGTSAPGPSDDSQSLSGCVPPSCEAALLSNHGEDYCFNFLWCGGRLCW